MPPLTSRSPACAPARRPGSDAGASGSGAEDGDAAGDVLGEHLKCTICHDVCNRPVTVGGWVVQAQGEGAGGEDNGAALQAGSDSSSGGDTPASRLLLQCAPTALRPRQCSILPCWRLSALLTPLARRPTPALRFLHTAQAPCQHNFCLSCLQGLVNKGGKKACPTCRAPFPPKFVSNPRVNTALTFAIRMAKQGKQQPAANRPFVRCGQGGGKCNLRCQE